MQRKTAITALVVSSAASGLILLAVGLLVEAGAVAEQGTWPHVVGGAIVVAAMAVAFVAFMSCTFSILTKVLLATMPRDRLIPHLKAWPFKFLLWKEIREEFDLRSY